jgi:hypothetical protein
MTISRLGGTPGCIKLRDFSLSSIGWRRGLGRGGAFLWFPLSLVLSPLVPRRERMVSLMFATKFDSFL